MERLTHLVTVLIVTLKDKKDKTAIIWVGDDPKDTKKISYKQLHSEVSKAANGLKKLGIKKGDRVTIYLTMIPELAITMLACARIGAVHSIIFGGFLCRFNNREELMTVSQSILLHLMKV